jgi:ABC-type branched-subunit amino acid transport system ATPase component/predicted MFS family arabinose efflux permease
MIPFGPPPGDARPWTERFRTAARHPIRWVDEITGAGPALPLLILTGLNGMDELARTSFIVVAPTVADDFGVGLAGIVVPFALAFAAALGLSVPIGTLADRHNRVRLAMLGGAVFAVFMALVGLSPNVWFLAGFLAGANLGKAVIDPAHTSLIADYYAVELRPRVFSFHRAGNAVGAFLGAISTGYIAYAHGWRAPFFVFAVPTAVLVLVGGRLREPVRGRQERASVGGGTAASLDTEEESPSLAEAWRMCWQIDSLRRIYRTLPFLTPAIAGFAIFAAFTYTDVYGLSVTERGWVVGLVEGPSQLAGLVIGARIGMKLFARDPKLVFGLLAKGCFVVTLAVIGFAWSPNVWVAMVFHVVISACLAFTLPAVFASLSLAIPPRARSVGFAMASVFVLAGLVSLPVIAAISESWGMRWGLTVLAPVFLLGGLVVASAGDLITRDILQVWSASAARAEALLARREGRAKLLLVRGLNVGYGDVQVLFDVDFEVDEGEIVALLGTNGAGKSTLLKAISGLVPANKGTVVFDGRDITYAPAHEIAPRGVVLLPGGQGTFPSLTVAENLRAAGWLERRSRRTAAAAVDEVLGVFPELRSRLDDPAADLSGGQQQMLALAMAFLTRPRLLLIDELSLGLAPVVVERLVEVVRRIREQGTTIVVVEQSVNVALTLAHEAYFMEKGEIRFHGSTEELLERPDVLRSVFLEGAAAGARVASGPNGGNGETTPPVPGSGSLSQERDPEPGTKEGAAPAVPALEVAGLTRSFGGIRAVDDVSFAVDRREIVGVIGPNGAGKTTVFDLVSGFLPADAGRIRLGGHDVTGLPSHARARRGLGRSFQDARLFPALTVEQCIAVALDRWVEVRDPIQAALHLPAVFDAEQAVRDRVDELIELLGLGAFRSKFVHELSTGSRRIVDLACLVAHRPTVILLDEPSSGIAQRETEALVPVIRRINTELGASVVLIEHDMPLVMAVAHRLVALDQGRVVATGAVADVLVHPDVVASYLGTDQAVIHRSGHRAGVASAAPATHEGQ